MRVAAYPKDRRWIVDLLEALGVFRAAECDDGRALFRYARPFFFSCLASLAVKNILRSFCGESQTLKRCERETEYLAGRVEVFDRVQNAPRPESRRQGKCQPAEPIFI